jgi:hypothetical protein
MVGPRGKERKSRLRRSIEEKGPPSPAARTGHPQNNGRPRRGNSVKVIWSDGGRASNEKKRRLGSRLGMSPFHGTCEHPPPLFGAHG